MFLRLFSLGRRFAAAFCKSSAVCSLLLNVPVLRNKPGKKKKSKLKEDL